MKNKDIQFFFNKPDRPVNSGRISTINAGTYSTSSKITPAGDKELDDFIAKFKHGERRIRSAPFNKIVEASIDDRALSLFQRKSDGKWFLPSDEHEECECKQYFDPKKMTHVVRSVAALANNKGGYIFFGISNKEYLVDGTVSGFEDIDVAQIMEKVKAHLSPTPTITKRTIDVGGTRLVFLHVVKHPDPPIIVYRDGEGLNEGEILFRYPGQSARIKFGDLRAMLDERDRRVQRAFVAVSGKLADIGTRNALILDTEKNILEANDHAILIDEKLAESLKFIKEGEFDEKICAPTLRLVGEVSPVQIKGVESGTIARAGIFQEHILDGFLEQTKVDQPIQYIYAVLAQSRHWLPIFYYVRMTGKSNEEIAEFVRQLKVSQKGKKKVLVDRLERRKTAYTKAVTKPAKAIAEDVSGGLINIPSASEEVNHFAQGITAVKNTSAKLGDLLAALRQCRVMAEAVNDDSAVGALYKAACWVDEMFFAGPHS